MMTMAKTARVALALCVIGLASDAAAQDRGKRKRAKPAAQQEAAPSAVDENPFADKPAEDADAKKPQVKSADVAPEPKEPAAKEPSADDAELAAIEQDLAGVMDELVQARARAGVLAKNLFHTELSVMASRRAKAQEVRSVILRLDGVPVHESDGSALAQQKTQLFNGYVTPGRHELAIEIVEAGRDEPSYGYTRRETYRVEIKKDRRTRVELTLYDDSDMAEEAAEGDEGDYQVETKLRVRSERVGD